MAKTKASKSLTPAPTLNDCAVSQARIASLLGCSTRTVREYLASGVIPATARHGNRLLEVAAVSAAVGYLREQAAGRLSSGSDGSEIDPVAANARLRIAQTEVAKEQLRVVKAKANLLEGETIRRPAVEAAIRGIISATRATVENLPREINSALGGGLSVDDQVAVEDLLERILTDMAKDMPAAVARTIAAELGDDEDEDFDQ